MDTCTPALHLILIDTQSGRRWPLRKRSLTLGSAAGCDLQLHGEEVALRHALIEQQQPGAFAVLDYGSAAGTWLNGEKIRRRLLSVGDILQIAGTTLLVAVGSAAALAGHESSHASPRASAKRAERNHASTSAEQTAGVANTTASSDTSAVAATQPAPPEAEALRLDGVACIAVQVCWGEQLLHAAQVRCSQRYVLGEDAAADMPLSSELLGVRRLELVNRRGEVSLVEEGEISAPRQLLAGEQLSMRCGDLTIFVQSILAPAPLRPSRWRSLSRGPLPLMLGALLTVAALPQAMAQWPRAPQAEEPTVSQYAFMRARLPEAEKEQQPPPADEPPPPKLAANGERGQALSKSLNDMPEQAIEHEQLHQQPQQAVLPQASESNEEWGSIEDASQFGLVALLGQSHAAEQNEASPWDAITPELNGIDWTSQDMTFGTGGLGLSGIGEGGGGIGHGIALGTLRVIPHVRRTWGWGQYRGTYCGGFDRHFNRLRRVPLMRMSWINVSGPVADDAVKRVVHGSSGAFNQCHQQEYKRDPSFRGITAVRFILTPRGRVFSAALNTKASSPQFGLCLRTAVLGLQFPMIDTSIASYDRNRTHVRLPRGEIAKVSFHLSFEIGRREHALGAPL